MARLFSLLVVAVVGVDVLPVLGEEESYLEPYLPICLEYRENPAVNGYIRLINLFDIRAPTWMEDAIETAYPGLTVPIPVDESFKLHLNVPGLVVPIDAQAHLTRVTLKDFNKIKRVKPIKLKPQTRFTWLGGIVLQDLTVVLQGELTVQGQDADVEVTLYLDEPAIDTDTVLALNDTRVCEVWSSQSEKDPACLLWTVLYNESWVRGRYAPRLRVDSGLNVTNLTLSVKDLDADVAVKGKSENWDPRLDPIVSKALKTLILQNKDVLIGLLQDRAYLVREVANADLTSAVRDAHTNPNCTKPEPQNISSACVHDVSGVPLESEDWSLLNCPALRPSQSLPALPVKASAGCIDVLDVYPDAIEGQVLRIAVQTGDGLRLPLDGMFRFAPGSQDRLVLNCSGDANCTWEVESPPSARSPMIVWSFALLGVIATLVGLTVAMFGPKRRSRSQQAEVLAVSLQPIA